MNLQIIHNVAISLKIIRAILIIDLGIKRLQENINLSYYIFVQ